MLTHLPLRIHRAFQSLSIATVAACFLLATSFAQAQTPQGVAAAAADHGRILLVLPFDNRTGQPSLEWIREAAADLVSSRLDSAGFAPMSRTDRLYALDHLGLPQGFQPSRASSLKLAQTLDADSIVVGSYSMSGGEIIAEAQLVDVPHLRMSPSVVAHGDMSDMIAIFDSLAWKLTKQLDPSFSVAEETFVAAGKSMRLDAFEQYIRGISEPDQAERQHHLEQAVKISPEYSAAWMALGRQQYTAQLYDQAAIAFSKVDRNGPDGLEAGFNRGISLLFSGDYANAEKAFADVARVLPLAEVVNNQAVAISRQDHDGTALFVQAAADDPTEPDYHFNLAVSLSRHGNRTAAVNELAQSLKLRPNDSEAQTLLDSWNRPSLPGVVSTAAEPLERIVRTFDAAAFRQAAVVMDVMDASHLAELSPLQQAEKLSAQAKSFLDRGLLLEAERLYQAAAAADSKAAVAHAGLAEVRERTGDLAAARKEAHTALSFGQSAQAYLVLARLDLAANNLTDANSEAGNALKIEPANSAAQDVLRQILARNGQGK